MTKLIFLLLSTTLWLTKLVLSQSDPSPCVDFNKFACRDQNESILLAMKKQMYQTMHKEVMQNDDQHLQKMRHLYSSCSNEQATKRQARTLLPYFTVNLMRQYYRFTSGVNGNREKFQKEFIVAKSVAPYHTLFRISPYPNPDNSSQQMLLISAPDLQLVPELMSEYLKEHEEKVISAALHKMVNLNKLVNGTLWIGDIVNMIRMEKILFRIWGKENIFPQKLTENEFKRHCPIIDSNSLKLIINRVTRGKVNQNVFPLLTSSKSALNATCLLIKSMIKSNNQYVILSNYLKWTAIAAVESISNIASSSSFSSSALSTNSFFYRWIHYKRKGNRSRPQKRQLEKTVQHRCLNVVNHVFPLLVSRLMWKMDKSNVKEKVNKIHNLVGSLKQMLRYLVFKANWLKVPDKMKIQAKIKAMKALLLHPDVVKDEQTITKIYDKLHLDPNNYMTNILKAAQFDYANSLLSLTEGTENHIYSGFEVNAYYMPEYNIMVIPHGIASAPMYPINEASKWVTLYARLGMVISHEMVHGITGYGLFFNERGSREDILNKESQRSYYSKSQCFVQQYNKYGVSGQRVFMENIADNVAIRVAIRAFKRQIGNDDQNDNGKYDKLRDFYVQYAKVFCSKKVPGNWTDVHSPGKFRVVGPLSNSYTFSEVYHCSKSTVMNPDNKCVLF